MDPEAVNGIVLIVDEDGDVAALLGAGPLRRRHSGADRSHDGRRGGSGRGGGVDLVLLDLQMPVASCCPSSKAVGARDPVADNHAVRDAAARFPEGERDDPAPTTSTSMLC